MRSDQAPETSFISAAVPSARPSIAPSTSGLAPTTVTRNAGSSPWIISDEVSVSRLTSPSTHTPAGSRDLFGADGMRGFDTRMPPHATPVPRDRAAAARRAAGDRPLRRLAAVAAAEFAAQHRDHQRAQVLPGAGPRRAAPPGARGDPPRGHHLHRDADGLARAGRARARVRPEPDHRRHDE